MFAVAPGSFEVDAVAGGIRDVDIAQRNRADFVVDLDTIAVRAGDGSAGAGRRAGAADAEGARGVRQFDAEISIGG